MPETTITITIPEDAAGRVTLLALRDGQGQIDAITVAGVAEIVALIGPALGDLLVKLEGLQLPEIVTSTHDEVQFYAGYKGWEPSDTEWGWDQPDYQPPSKQRKVAKTPTQSKPEAQQLAMF